MLEPAAAALPVVSAAETSETPEKATVGFSHGMATETEMEVPVADARLASVAGFIIVSARPASASTPVASVPAGAGVGAGAALQTLGPALHCRPAAQSEVVWQRRLISHASHGPPQSRSLSAPFRMASEHEGAAQRAPTQSLEAQSELAAQMRPVAQAAQPLVAPAQSTSSSSPFFFPSVHVAAVQMPLWQLPLSQSLSPLQDELIAHFFAQLPPQSTAASSPSFLPLAQLMAAHLRLRHVSEPVQSLSRLRQ